MWPGTFRSLRLSSCPVGVVASELRPQLSSEVHSRAWLSRLMSLALERPGALRFCPDFSTSVTPFRAVTGL